MSDLTVTLPTLAFGGRKIEICQKKPNYKYYITLTGKNNHYTHLQGNSDLLLKWARNVAEIFDKKMIVVMPSGWIEKNNWIPIL